MFTKSPHQIGLEKAINELLNDMTSFTSDSKEYTIMVDQLTKLYSLKVLDRPKRISPDTLAIVAGNLIGILVIVGHERANIVTSKALSFVLKLR